MSHPRPQWEWVGRKVKLAGEEPGRRGGGKPALGLTPFKAQLPCQNVQSHRRFLTPAGIRGGGTCALRTFPAGDQNQISLGETLASAEQE